MPNQLTPNGLQVNTLTEILTSLTQSFQEIYGENIILDQNSPDAQLLNIFAQMMVSYGELLQDINAGFDPDQATGVILDQRVKLNGITRRQGSYTTVTVNLYFSGSATIKGLDLYSLDDCFQVSDSSGNIVVAAVTTTGVAGNTKAVLFRAKEYGALVFPENSITKIVTTVNNVSLYSQNTNIATAPEDVGSDEESDTELKIRREIVSKRKSAFGTVDALQTQLANIEGITYADVQENDTSSEFNGIPAHGIWVILKGVAESNQVIADTIYNYRVLGTPMKGSVTQNVTRPNGDTFTAKWDIASVKNVYCRVNCFIYNQSLDADAIKNRITEDITPQVGKVLETTSIANVLIKNFDNIIIENLQISEDGVSWVSYIEPSPDKFLRIPEANITVTEFTPSSQG